MANLLHKFTKSKPIWRNFTALNTHLLPKPVSPLTAPKSEFAENPIPVLDSISDKAEISQCSQIFPSFPFGYCLNPISSTGFYQLGVHQAEEVESEDARTIWADSVKKKRKKKMNKHKYKKLRKRLRRKART